MMITAKEIMDLLGVSQAYAYRIIIALNNKLEKMGYMTVRGRTSRKFFFENYYIN